MKRQHRIPAFEKVKKSIDFSDIKAKGSLKTSLYYEEGSYYDEIALLWCGRPENSPDQDGCYR